MDEDGEQGHKNTASDKNYCKRFKTVNMLNKLRALVALGLLVGVLYIIVYNMFVPHSEKKEIPQELIQTLIKLAAGGVQLSPITQHLENITSL